MEMENSVILVAVCNGSYTNNDGKTFSTYRLLLRREGKRGVFYELDKYDPKSVSADDLADHIDCPVRLFYDQFGRIVSL